MQLAVELNIPNLHVEMDYREIVRKLQSKEKDLSSLGPFVEEVKQLLATRESWRVTWARRSANKAAHLLAREEVANNFCKDWLQFPPDCILSVISDEIPAWEV